MTHVYQVLSLKLGIHGATKSLATPRVQQIAPCSVRSRDDFYLARQVARDRTAFYFLRQNRTNFKETPPFLQQRIRVERNSRAESAIESAMASTKGSTERVERLIELYEARSCLYDTKSKEYFNRDKRTKALQEISDALNVPGVSDLMYMP